MGRVLYGASLRVLKNSQHVKYDFVLNAKEADFFFKVPLSNLETSGWLVRNNTCQPVFAYYSYIGTVRMLA
jgi:hypothetical protein